MTSHTDRTGLRDHQRGRLLALMAAGLVDSLFLSMAWTVVVLQVTMNHGLAAAAMCSTAMLVGVALSAPTAGWMARRLNGRQLLRSAAAVESVLRLGVFALLFTDAPLFALAVCVTAMNAIAWTGYAGMRAEVAAVTDGATGLTWYGTVVAAVEAVGVAIGALLPITGGADSGRLLLPAVAVVYVLALVPTAIVAGGSQVPRALSTPTDPRPRRLRTVSAPAFSGVALMFAASAPTLLSVALAAQLHGRSSVGLAAVAFIVGSLASPALAARVQAWGVNRPTTWVLCGVGMVAGWAAAPYSVLFMCLAQLSSGLCMTALEGLLDANAAHRRPDEVTGALARATAGRALGSAAGTALLPFAIAGVGLQQGVAVVTAVLLAVAATLHLTGHGRHVVVTVTAARSGGERPREPLAAHN